MCRIDQTVLAVVLRMSMECAALQLKFHAYRGNVGTWHSELTWYGQHDIVRVANACRVAGSLSELYSWRDEPRLTSWGCARMLFYTTIFLSASLFVFDVESFAIVGFQ